MAGVLTTDNIMNVNDMEQGKKIFTDRIPCVDKEGNVKSVLLNDNMYFNDKQTQKGGNLFSFCGNVYSRVLLVVTSIDFYYPNYASYIESINALMGGISGYGGNGIISIYFRNSFDGTLYPLKRAITETNFIIGNFSNGLFEGELAPVGAYCSLIFDKGDEEITVALRCDNTQAVTQSIKLDDDTTRPFNKTIKQTVDIQWGYKTSHYGEIVFSYLG